MKSVKTVKEKVVSCTGACWITHKDLDRKVSKKGGIFVSDGDVRNYTDIFVRGRSNTWKFGSHGKREQRVADLVRDGRTVAVVDDLEFKKLIEDNKTARCSDYLAGQPIEWIAQPPSKSTFEKIAKASGSLDREHTTNGRVEQAYLRAGLLRSKPKDRCSICGRLLPVNLLVAAHIKPRSECTRRERLDAENIVFPLCLVGCDAFYERGLISVDPSGMVVVARKQKTTVDLRSALRRLAGRACRSWTTTSSEYFQWHFEKRFLG